MDEVEIIVWTLNTLMNRIEKFEILQRVKSELRIVFTACPNYHNCLRLLNDWAFQSRLVLYFYFHSGNFESIFTLYKVKAKASIDFRRGLYSLSISIIFAFVHFLYEIIPMQNCVFDEQLEN